MFGESINMISSISGFIDKLKEGVSGIDRGIESTNVQISNSLVDSKQDIEGESIKNISVTQKPLI